MDFTIDFQNYTGIDIVKSCRNGFCIGMAPWHIQNESFCRHISPLQVKEITLYVL